MIDLSLVELAVTYNALTNYISKLENCYKSDKDILVKGELEFSRQAKEKIRANYISKKGSADGLD